MRKIASAVLAAVIMLSMLLPITTLSVSADDLPTFYITVDRTEVHPKQTVTVSVNIKNTDACIYGIATLEAALIYDTEKLTLADKDITVSSVITGAGMMVNTSNNVSSGLVKVMVYPTMSDDPPGFSRTVSYVFSCRFTVKDDVAEGSELVFKLVDPEDEKSYDRFVLNAWDEEKLDPPELETVEEGPVSVSVLKLLSEDATLKSLSIDGYELNKEFKKDTIAYAIAVPNEVRSIKVNYETSSEFASAKLSGNTKFAVGANTVKIVVTAEDGVTKKTYTITVTRQPAPEESSVVSEPSSDVPPDSSEPTPSEPSSDVPPDSSEPTPSEPDSSEPVSEPTSSGPSPDESYVDAMQKQIEDLKTENLGLRDRETAVVIIFSVISALLLAALIIVSINYKKDIK